MKNITIQLLSLTLALFGIFSMNSCIESSCNDLNCQNGATCLDDHCMCPPGYEGPECHIYANTRFLGQYVGHSKCEGFPQYEDTVNIYNFCNPDRVIMFSGLGNTYISEFPATARTPELKFETFEDDNVIVNPYVRVDANQLQVKITSINKRDGLRYMCEFEGRRVPGTDTIEAYTKPYGVCD